MLDNMGGRKLIAAVITLALATTVVLVKGELPANMVSLLEFLFGALVAGNAVEHVSGAVTARASNKVEQDDNDSVGSLDIQNLSNQMNGLASNDQALAQNISLIQQTLSLIITRTGIDKMPDPKV